jgi:hypothetical protein
MSWKKHISNIGIGIQQYLLMTKNADSGLKVQHHAHRGGGFGTPSFWSLAVFFGGSSLKFTTPKKEK